MRKNGRAKSGRSCVPGRPPRADATIGTIESSNKGDPLERALLRCDLAIYVGDDDTGEDAFVRARAGRLLGIRTGQRRRSNGANYLQSQDEIDALLQRLVELRPARGAGDGRAAARVRL
jgi:hypothetical protein